MSLQQDLHRAHLERRARLYGVKRPQATPDPRGAPHVQLDPVTSAQAADHRRSDGATAPLAAASSRLAATKRRSLREILGEVAAQHGLSPADVAAPGRPKERVAARAEFYYRAMMETAASLPRIARAVGREHSSVIAAVSFYCAERALPLPRDAQWRGRRRAAALARAAKSRAGVDHAMAACAETFA